MHHGVQEKGRFEVFEDYHLRVGEVTADTQAPSGGHLEQQRFDATEVGAAKVISVCEGEVVPELRAPVCTTRSCMKTSRNRESSCDWCLGKTQRRLKPGTPDPCGFGAHRGDP